MRNRQGEVCGQSVSTIYANGITCIAFKQSGLENQPGNPHLVCSGAALLDLCQRKSLENRHSGVVFIAGNFTLPPHVGLRVGKGTNKRGFQLNIHYDNPLLLQGERDASGVRLHMTPTLRQEEVTHRPRRLTFLNGQYSFPGCNEPVKFGAELCTWF